jgi:putative toxin-antitoxin system antitoxin component (TIGR02293 family)
MSAIPPKSPLGTKEQPSKPPRRTKRPVFPEYQRKRGAAAYIKAVVSATPLERVEIERRGVSGAFIKEFSRKIGVPTVRVFKILGIPRATAEKKAAAGQLVKGSGGQAAVGMIRLLGIAEDIIANSTSEKARDFDAGKWLGVWIERSQPALGGRKPADLLDTPTGIEVVAKLLGSLESGAFQ